MNSRNLKLVIIFIFLFVNAFFLFQLKSLTDAKSYFNESEINQAVELLETKGIKINSTTVMPEKAVPKTIKFDFSIASAEKLANELMRDEHGSFKIPNGQSFANDTESLSAYYDFGFEYQIFDYKLTYDDVDAVLQGANENNEKQIKKTKKLLEKLIKKICPDNQQLTVEVDRYAKQNGLSYVQATEYFNGYKIDNATFSAVIDNENIVFLSGKLYFSNQVSSYKTDALDSINILFEIEPTDSVIEKMELIYFPVSDKNNTYYLTPAYRFTYDNAKIETYDATSGVRRAE